MTKAQAVSKGLKTVKTDGYRFFRAIADYVGLATSWVLLYLAQDADKAVVGNLYIAGIGAALLAVGMSVLGIVKVRGVLLVLPVLCLVLSLITVVYLSFWLGMTAFFWSFSDRLN